MVLADPRLRLHQRRRHDQVPGGGGQAQVVGGAQALDDERTCPNERWRGVRRAVGGGDGTLVGNGRAGGGSGDAMPSWAHMSRECATNPAKSKGKEKDNGGYGGFKGKGKGMAMEEATKVSEAEERAVTSRARGRGTWALAGPAARLGTSRASVCTTGPQTQWRTTLEAPCPCRSRRRGSVDDRGRRSQRDRRGTTWLGWMRRLEAENRDLQPL